MPGRAATMMSSPGWKPAVSVSEHRISRRNARYVALVPAHRLDALVCPVHDGLDMDEPLLPLVLGEIEQVVLELLEILVYIPGDIEAIGGEPRRERDRPAPDRLFDEEPRVIFDVRARADAGSDVGEISRSAAFLQDSGAFERFRDECEVGRLALFVKLDDRLVDVAMPHRVEDFAVDERGRLAHRLAAEHHRPEHLLLEFGRMRQDMSLGRPMSRGYPIPASSHRARIAYPVRAHCVRRSQRYTSVRGSVRRSSRPGVNSRDTLYEVPMGTEGMSSRGRLRPGLIEDAAGTSDPAPRLRAMPDRTFGTPVVPRSR